MKPSTFLNLCLAANAVCAGVVTKEVEPTSYSIDKRDNCRSGMLKVYSNGDTFICIGTTVYWSGLAIATLYAPTVSSAASQFATWVTNKFTGSPSAVEQKREETTLNIVDEDDEFITYGWSPPKVRARDGGEFSWIHSMTKQYSKLSGELSIATMTFDGEHAALDGNVSRRDSTPITITYYAQSGHQESSLGYQDLNNLFTQAFFNSAGGVGSECGYAANSGTWHGAFKITVSGCPDAGSCYNEQQY